MQASLLSQLFCPLSCKQDPHYYPTRQLQHNLQLFFLCFYSSFLWPYYFLYFSMFVLRTFLVLAFLFPLQTCPLPSIFSSLPAPTFCSVPCTGVRRIPALLKVLLAAFVPQKTSGVLTVPPVSAYILCTLAWCNCSNCRDACKFSIPFFIPVTCIIILLDKFSVFFPLSHLTASSCGLHSNIFFIS